VTHRTQSAFLWGDVDAVEREFDDGRASSLYGPPVDERSMTNVYRERDSMHFHYEIRVTSCFFAEGVVRYDE
jgi:hypothetical protein